MLGMAGFDCVFALQHSYSRDRCDTIFRIRSWTQHHPSPLSLIGKRADFSGISNDKTNGPGAGVPTRTLRQGCLYEEEKYLSAVREEPDIYGKVCPTAGEALPEREQTPYPAPPAKSKFRPGHRMLAGFGAAAPGPDGREYLPFLPAVLLPH